MLYNIEQIERLLDECRLEVLMRNGRYWTIRRNGVTKRWARDNTRFRIPFKAGLKTYGAIESLDLANEGIRVKPNTPGVE